MPNLVPVRYVNPAQRLRFGRFLRCLPGFSRCKAQGLFAQLVSYSREGSRPRRQLLKWVDDGRRQAAVRHRLPVRLRKHVHVIADPY